MSIGFFIILLYRLALSTRRFYTNCKPQNIFLLLYLPSYRFLCVRCRNNHAILLYTFCYLFLSVPALLSCLQYSTLNSNCQQFFQNFFKNFQVFYFCFSAHYRNSEQFDSDNYYHFTAMERRRSWPSPIPIILSLHMLLYALYITHIIYLLVFIIFILYRSLFRARAIRSYSFPVNISAQYSFGGLLFFLHYTIIQYIFAKLFYIIIPYVLSLHDISILFVYPMLHIFHHIPIPYSLVSHYIYYLSISMITLYYYIYYYVYYLRFGR